MSFTTFLADFAAAVCGLGVAAIGIVALAYWVLGIIVRKFRN